MLLVRDQINCCRLTDVFIKIHTLTLCLLCVFRHGKRGGGSEQWTSLADRTDEISTELDTGRKRQTADGAVRIPAQPHKHTWYELGTSSRQLYLSLKKE